jgi:PHD/YefM family antitoxin component YafN of YafNO toxin-antitoxin module
MTTHVIDLERLDAKLRSAIDAADDEPLVILVRGRPAYLLRSLHDDDVLDELLALSPGFLDSIRLAREEKATGRVRSLAEVQAEYMVKDNGKTP